MTTSLSTQAQTCLSWALAQVSSRKTSHLFLSQYLHSVEIKITLFHDTWLLIVVSSTVNLSVPRKEAYTWYFRYYQKAKSDCSKCCEWHVCYCRWLIICYPLTIITIKITFLLSRRHEVERIMWPIGHSTPLNWHESRLNVVLRPMLSCSTSLKWSSSPGRDSELWLLTGGRD